MNFKNVVNTNNTSNIWHEICKLSQLENGRKRVEIEGRDVLVLTYKNKLYAMDGSCYHFGGPLEESDIEEIGNRKCLVCPWHRFRIDLETGEGIQYDGSSKGPQQRIHMIKIENGGVWVKLSQIQDTGPLASDHYAMMGLAAYKKSEK